MEELLSMDRAEKKSTEPKISDGGKRAAGLGMAGYPLVIFFMVSFLKFCDLSWDFMVV